MNSKQPGGGNKNKNIHLLNGGGVEPENDCFEFSFSLKKIYFKIYKESKGESNMRRNLNKLRINLHCVFKQQ